MTDAERVLDRWHAAQANVGPEGTFRHLVDLSAWRAGVGLYVFRDGSSLWWPDHTVPELVALTDGLRRAECLNRDTLAWLLISPHRAIRVAAITALAEL